MTPLGAHLDRIAAEATGRHSTADMGSRTTGMPGGSATMDGCLPTRADHPNVARSGHRALRQADLITVAQPEHDLTPYRVVVLQLYALMAAAVLAEDDVPGAGESRSRGRGGRRRGGLLRVQVPYGRRGLTGSQ
ncbi:hypothetical protein ACFY1U_10995 [Streptomyces sp. NPDC001351]|uniref:hypothetical protein n=1 Tax=Streptomyces sp. NPDC001351 TaxID=3364564 RepID=UPI0036C97341